MNSDVDVDVDDDVLTNLEKSQTETNAYQTGCAFGGVRTPQRQLFNQQFFLHNVSQTIPTQIQNKAQSQAKSQCSIPHAGSGTKPGTKSVFHTASSKSFNKEFNTNASQRAAIISDPSAVCPPVTKNLKILVLGNAKCGKSSLINRYCHGTFSERYKTTIGADFIRKDISFQSSKVAAPVGVRLQLWDIAGQDRFQKLTRAYFSKARGVVIVCDLNRDGTIEAVRQWKREVTEWATISGSPHLPIILLANKSDMMDKTDPQAAFKFGVLMERLCREENFLAWFMTSARSGEGVEDGFNELIDEIMQGPSQPSGDNCGTQQQNNVLDSNSDADRGFKLSASTTSEGNIVSSSSNRSWGCY